MNAVDALKSSHGLSKMVFRSYLSDLSDAELLERPGEGCNHIAYQLGHLIVSGGALLEAVGAATVPSLPDGFADKYTPETNGIDDPAAFESKDRYLELFDEIDAAFTASLEACSADDLDKPSPEKFRDFAPTIGDVYSLIATHALMHAGQWVPIRRRLGKPVMM